MRGQPKEQDIQGGIELTIAILVYNKQDDIRYVLESMCHQEGVDFRWEVVVVDDGSSDLTRSQVAEFSGRLDLKIIELPHTGNRGDCRNKALAGSTGRNLLFLDGDMILSRDFLKRHMDNARGGAVSLGRRVRLVQFDRAMITTSAIGRNFSIIEDLPGFEDERTSQALYFDKAGSPHEMPWMQFYSHNFCISRATFLEVGGFDEDFSKNWGLEDVELGYRLHKAGKRILYDPGIVSYHIPHPEDMERKILQLRKNMSIFYRKHPRPEIELYSIEHRIWPVKFFTLLSDLKRHSPQALHPNMGLTTASDAPVPDVLVSAGFSEALRRRRKSGPRRHAIILTVMDSQENCYNQNFFHNFANGLLKLGVLVELRHVHDGMAERPLNGYFGSVTADKVGRLQDSRMEYLGAIDDLVPNIHDMVLPWQTTRSIGKRYVWRDRPYHNDDWFHSQEQLRTEGFFHRSAVVNGPRWLPIGVDGRFFTGVLTHDVSIFLKNAWEMPRFEEFLGALRGLEGAGIRTHLFIGSVSPIVKSPFVNHAFYGYLNRNHVRMRQAQEKALNAILAEGFRHVKVFQGDLTEETLAKSATSAVCTLDWSYHRETSPWAVYALLAGRVLATPNPELYGHYAGEILALRTEVIAKREEGVVRVFPGAGLAVEDILGINRIDPEYALREVKGRLAGPRDKPAPDFREFEWGRLCRDFVKANGEML